MCFLWWKRHHINIGHLWSFNYILCIFPAWSNYSVKHQAQKLNKAPKIYEDARTWEFEFSFKHLEWIWVPVLLFIFENVFQKKSWCCSNLTWNSLQLFYYHYLSHACMHACMHACTSLFIFLSFIIFPMHAHTYNTSFMIS